MPHAIHGVDGLLSWSFVPVLHCAHVVALEPDAAGRIGTPEDTAQAAAFFLAEDSGFINGQTLYVCGASSIGRAGV